MEGSAISGTTIRHLAERLTELTSELQEVAHSDRPVLSKQIDPRALARSLYRERQRRAAAFPELDAKDGSWNLLLDMFAADQPVTVSSACLATLMPPTTGLRQVTALVREGLLERYPSSGDQRIHYVELTPGLRERLRMYLIEYARRYVDAP